MSKKNLIDELFRGSVVTLRRRCGKTNCRCRNGDPHETPALSYSLNGRTCMLTLRDEDVPRVRKGLERHKKERASVDERALKGIKRLRDEIQSHKKREKVAR